MSTTIYIVCGAVGEYSDFREWIVRAFTCEDKAKAFCTLCQEAVSPYLDKDDGEEPTTLLPMDVMPDHRLARMFQGAYEPLHYFIDVIELEQD